MAGEGLQSSSARGGRGLGSILWDRVEVLLRSLFAGYRPEKHYMRGSRPRG